jgi:hypothetical protein
MLILNEPRGKHAGQAVGTISIVFRSFVKISTHRKQIWSAVIGSLRNHFLGLLVLQGYLALVMESVEVATESYNF